MWLMLRLLRLLIIREWIIVDSFGPAGVVVPSLHHGSDLVSIYPPLVMQIINEISDFYELINSMAMHAYNDTGNTWSDWCLAR